MNPIYQLNALYISSITSNSPDTACAMIRQLVCELAGQGYTFHEEEIRPGDFGDITKDRNLRKMIDSWELNLLRKKLAVSAGNFESVAVRRNEEIRIIHGIVRHLGQSVAARKVFFHPHPSLKCIVCKLVPATSDIEGLKMLIESNLQKI